jgi:hypothetical protein
MGVVASRRRGLGTELVLVRNHEVGLVASADVINAPAVYDSGDIGPRPPNKVGGGTTNLLFRDGHWAGMTPSLGGTAANCAGGVTPWGTWLSCEEVGLDLASSAGNKHGYVFEVAANPAETTGRPIVGMGRFAHEAVAVDPATGFVYQTEDDTGKSGLYRYVPDVRRGAPGSLALGGVLQMARVKGELNTNLAPASVDATYELEWIDIPHPDQNRGNSTGPTGIAVANASGPFVQGWAHGALRMNRGEGVWHTRGKLFVMDTAGGMVARGAIWELDLATQVLRCIYSSPDPLVGNMGDNLTVSPRQAILICEDGTPAATDSFGFGQRLMGLTRQGNSYIFAKNNVVLDAAQLRGAGKLEALAGDHRNREFAGACFDPTGRYLFVNIYLPGITFAITGPWARGPL